jgi:cellulose biosynthesis protein BcsQ
MKSKLNTQQENNFRTVSKVSFIGFGIVVALMGTSAFANNGTQKTTLVTETAAALQKQALTTDHDTTITISNSFKKTIEDVIKEDNLIIESNISNEVYPLHFNKIYKTSSKLRKVKGQNRFSQNPSLQS